MYYVVGSGPAGVSAATALLARGREVTMLDAGFTLEADRAAVVARMGAQKKSNWDRESISIVKENANAHVGGVDVKHVYGSDFPFRGMEDIQPIIMKGARMVRTLARGGLSTVWGGSILPSRKEDITDWPITVEELEPHYRAVLTFMVHAGHADALDDLLPQYGDAQHPFLLSRQAESFLDDLRRNRKRLAADGIVFGHSRLAVNFREDDEKNSCQYCGLCLYGCPCGNIFSSAQTVERLRANERFFYIDGVVVEKIAEQRDDAIIEARLIATGAKKIFVGRKVFLGAGLLSSTRILLNSLEAFHHRVTIKHSDHFQIPLVRYRGTENPADEDLHTLPQLYLEILDTLISKNTIHLQVYGYNDLYPRVIEKLLGPLALLLKKPVDALLARLFIIKGYLHSDISSRVYASLEPGDNGALILEGRKNDEAALACGKVTAKLLRNRKNLRALPLSFMAKVDEPGKGNHSGGSFPMRQEPADFETDTLGRPRGFTNLHVVDSTVLPTVPATTITLTIMANAHRIGSIC